MPAHDSTERLRIVLPKVHDGVALTHWTFGLLASIAGAPASYLCLLPAPLAGANLQYGFINRAARTGDREIQAGGYASVRVPGRYWTT